MFDIFKSKKSTSTPHQSKHTNSKYQFEYTIIKKPKTKNCYIRIKDNSVIITASATTSDSYLHDFVDSKATWIDTKLQEYSNDIKTDLTSTNATLPLLGKELTVKITQDSNIKKQALTIEQNQAHFTLNSTPTNTNLKKLRDNLYKTIAPQHITPIVEKQSSTMQLFPTNITYRKTKSRWGSCSSKNTLSLNTRLMMLPPQIISYIVIHELAHIKHKNHSKDFWSLVEKYCPDYKMFRKNLRSYEKLF